MLASHCVLPSYGLVPHLSKELSKLLIQLKWPYSEKPSGVRSLEAAIISGFAIQQLASIWIEGEN